MRNWDKAIETLTPLTEDLLYATPHYPLTNLGWAYFNKKEYETAVQYYLRAVKKEPTYMIAARGLGKTYVEMGKPADAIPVFEKAMELAPRFAEVYADAGKAYAMVGDKAKALDAYKKFLALAPNHPRTEEVRKMMMVLDKK
jgi:tetratricopeptide (TPR) repeat protein